MSSSTLAPLAPVAIGTVVALGVLTYAVIHEPTGRSLIFAGPDGVESTKQFLTAAAVGLFTAQAVLGQRADRVDHVARHRGGPRNAGMLIDLQRIAGSLAFALTLPVVVHCVWALGWPSGGGQMVHAALGAIAYGSYVAHVFASHSRRAPLIAKSGTWVTVMMVAALVAVAFAAEGT